MTQKAINPTQLAKNLGLDHSVVRDELERSGLATLFQAKYGRGTIRYYELEAANACIKAYLERREAAKKAQAATATPAAALEPGKHFVEVAALERQVAVLTEAVEDLLEVQKALQVSLDLVVKQNRELFRRMELQWEFEKKLADSFGFNLDKPAVPA